MKIGQPIDTRTAGVSSGVSKAGQSSSSSTTKTSVAKGVPVTVSNMAQAMESAKGPDIDTAKVETVRAAIANGTYKVNADAIADKLLSNAREMFTSKNH